MKSFIKRFFVASSVVMCLFGGKLLADSIAAGNFSPGQALGQGGWDVTGVKNPQVPGESVQTAVSFVSATTGELTQIEAAIQLISGQNAFLLSLNFDSSGTPGPILEQWLITDAAPFGDGGPSYNGYELLNSNGGIRLQDGQSYWIVASPLDPNSDTYGAWHDTSSTAVGVVEQQMNGVGWQVFSGDQPAFSVQVPEANTVFLLVVGILFVCINACCSKGSRSCCVRG
jgi:hypothetical protein